MGKNSIVVWLYIQRFCVLCLPNTFEYGYKVNKRKRNEICKSSINKYRSRDRKKIDLVSVYRLCRRSSLVARSKVSGRSNGCKFGP